MFTYKNIWQFLQGERNDQEKQDFLDWLSHSKENHQDLLIAKSLWAEANKIQDYILVDPNESWNMIAPFLHGSKFSQKTVSRWMGMAAVILLLISILLWFYLPKEATLYQELYTQNQAYEILLPDSSRVQVDKFSHLRYYSRMDEEMSKRILYLEGKARFDVTSDSTRPFLVESGKTGIEALGTTFSIDQKDRNIIQLENIEGLIRFYELANEEHAVIVQQGEIFIYDGTEFQDISPNLEIKVEKGEITSIESILNYLFIRFDGRFNTGPYGYFDLQKEIRIDLDQNLEDIIDDLDQKTKMVYKKTCFNCFEIQSLVVEEDVASSLKKE